MLYLRSNIRFWRFMSIAAKVTNENFTYSFTQVDLMGNRQ